MAKIVYGGPVANASGSTGGVVYSRNRYGTYMRRRATPVTSTTIYAEGAKARFAAASSAWRTLTTAQRAAWVTWAQTNPVVDSLGQQQVLTGQAAYVGINGRILLDGGAQVGVPPIAATPNALTTVSLTADIGAGDVAVTFAPTPLGAGEKLWVQAAVVDSSGIVYVRNLLKLVQVSALAQVSPLDVEAAVVVRFGTLLLGQKIVVECSVFAPATGLLSQPARAEAIVTSTP